MRLRKSATARPASRPSFDAFVSGSSGREIIQPEAQLAIILDRKLRDRVLYVFEGHHHRLTIRPRGLNPDKYTLVALLHSLRAH
jgi:hypothetical protein